MEQFVGDMLRIDDHRHRQFLGQVRQRVDLVADHRRESPVFEMAANGGAEGRHARLPNMERLRGENPGDAPAVIAGKPCAGPPADEFDFVAEVTQSFRNGGFGRFGQRDERRRPALGAERAHEVPQVNAMAVDRRVRRNERYQQNVSRSAFDGRSGFDGRRIRFAGHHRLLFAFVRAKTVRAAFARRRFRQRRLTTPRLRIFSVHSAN